METPDPAAVGAASVPATRNELRFEAAPELEHGGPATVTGLWLAPRDARYVLVLGHGAGSHCRHALVQGLSQALADQQVATFRFNYPYSERGGGMSSLPVRLATVRSAASKARSLAPQLPLFAGGHSMSGRMFSSAMAERPIEAVQGLVLFAFPLHSGPPDRKRAQHLTQLSCPLLFLSGDRDAMANGELLRQVVNELPQAQLEFIETADHGYRVLKRRRHPESAFEQLARETRTWMDATAGPAATV